MRKNVFVLGSLLAASLTAGAQQTNEAVEQGPFSPSWESVSAWECPEWFKDAKFGIWAHWGPQCEAEDGDWYARGMYFEGSDQYNYHVQHYGDPSVFGFKDLINEWKAEEWNPEALIQLYKSVGARYFMTLGQHHDNFDLWNSPYQEWNSVNMGPKRDIVKEWSEACEKYGLPLGVSMHGSHTWTWFEIAQDYDGNLTKEDGTGLWWEGYDPQELYAQQHTPSTNYELSGTIGSQWAWGNGASQPSEAYMRKFQNRVLECIKDYNPKMLYFDDTVLPFVGVTDTVALNILADFYNHSANENGGEQDVVVTGKILKNKHKQALLWDVERGIPDKPQDDYWQTCTCLGVWHYDRSIYENNGYKSAQQVIDMLVDIISKNGNLLLSVPIRGNGTIDEKEQTVLAGIKAWMDVNSSSIYGTRPWKNFGEGPLAEASNALTDQGFNEGNNYSADDVRYVQRNDTVFATIMRWPAAGDFTFTSFSKASKYYSGEVKSVTLLGTGDVSFRNDIDGLIVSVPENTANAIAPVFAITCDTTDTSVSLADIIALYEQKIEELRPQVSYNTGKWDSEAIEDFAQTVEDSKAQIGTNYERTTITTLANAYASLQESGRNAIAVSPGEEGAEDLTTADLVEGSGFSTIDMGTRFGTPENWTVENYYIPQLNTAKGVKNGIDNYPGYNCLYLGVWSGEDDETTSDLTNARIYRTLHLEAGRYFFGAAFESFYQLSNSAYIYAAGSNVPTQNLEDESFAFAHINDASADGKVYGIYFTLPEEQDVVLGFQANLNDGSTTQEFRAQSVKLLYYGAMDMEALEQLCLSADALTEEVKVNNNTGFYKKEAVEKLKAALDVAWAIDENSTFEEFEQAYNTLQAAIDDFKANGKNPGGAPVEANAQDITVATLSEASDFARTDETNDGDRFGAPKYWTVENFGFGDEAGLDNITGPECLHLEVWWNSSSFPENGYDITKARLYQKATLPAGRYFFGASYSSSEPNDELYIFASESLLETADIPNNSIAYDHVNSAPLDGTFYGLSFTLEQETEVYLGFQADFSNLTQANLRASGVKLLYYGEITATKVLELADAITDTLATFKVNENTGFYSQAAVDKLNAAVEAARAVSDSDSYETIEEAYNVLTDAFSELVQNGKNPGGEPDETDAQDITVATFSEASNFARTDETDDDDRFGAPKYWTVENFGFGDEAGIDNVNGPECLHLEVWWNSSAFAENGYDITKARLYQKATLPEGRYFFGAAYDACEPNNELYIFASDALLETNEIQQQSIAYDRVNNAPLDGTFYGLYFTLEQETEVYLGFQADFSNLTQANVRAEGVKLLYYGTAVGIHDLNTDAPVNNAVPQDNRIYGIDGRYLGTSLSRLQPGLYIQNGRKILK